METPPAETHECDLVVIGGGLAGLCAALAAAEEGVRVALVHERPVLGGNCSSEVRVIPHGANHANPWAAATGLVHAFILDDRATSHEPRFDHGMIGGMWDFLLLRRAEAGRNLQLFLNTVVREVETELLEPDRAPETTANGLGRLGGSRRRLIAVRATQLGSERELRLVAPQFVDATGDGTVGFLAGADFRYGREARAEFDEPLAPIVSDDVTMGSTLTMRAMDIGRAVPFVPPDWIEPYTKPEDFAFDRHLEHLDKPVFGGYWWIEVTNPFHQIRDNAAIRRELHRHVLGVWNYIKNHAPAATREKASTYVLDWIGMVPGKRESRRLMGDVVVTEHDCHHEAEWPDAFGLYGWWIDLHIAGGVLNRKAPGERENIDRHYKNWTRIPARRLPLRAHYSRNVENLWMAGRNVSVTHVALGPIRVMQTLGHFGQGVGIAAAEAVRAGLPPRDAVAPGSPTLARILHRMRLQDVRVPAPQPDPEDLVRGANVRASSEGSFNTPELMERQWYRIADDVRPWPDLHAHGWAAIVPLTESRLNRARLFLANDLDVPAEVRLSVQAVSEIWERYDRPELTAATALLAPGFCGWVDFAFGDAAVVAGQSHRFALSGPSGVRWCASGRFPPGACGQALIVFPEGPEDRNRDLPCFAPDEVLIRASRHWRGDRWMPAIQVEPAPNCFAAAAVGNGNPWSDDAPNLWMSASDQGLPQWLECDFGAEVSLARVELTFDTHLARLTQSEAPFFRAPECVRDWRLLVETPEGGWREVFVETGNYQRRRTARFDSVSTRRLRLEVLATNGAPEARVYELRAYAD